MKLACLLAIAALVLADNPASTAPVLTLPEILREMDRRDQARSTLLKGYTCLRRYSLENRRFHKKAELNVRMTYMAPGHKTFEVMSETGPAVLRQKVLHPMLAAEEEAGRDDVRPLTRLVEANYSFQLLGQEVQQGRAAYLLRLSPKTKNKFLIRGKVWVDAKDFEVVRVEASPAVNPSILIHNTKVVQESQRHGAVWLPLSNRSRTDSFLFGRTEVSIDSWDYQVMEEGATGHQR
jgi:hypothetical protein